MAEGVDALAALTRRLRDAAAALREGELAPERAAALVDECAGLAADAHRAAEGAVRAGEDGAPGQLPLA